MAVVNPRLRVLSLGAGVQSTTMALMAANGEIGPMPDCAIFADTGWEPKAVYDHLEWLTSDGVLPFQVHIVSIGNIKKDLLEGGVDGKRRFAAIPFFTEGGGMGRRQCTREYKITPIEKKQRALLGYLPRKRIPAGSSEVWIGISTDEAMRMRPARNTWQTNRWPLIERGMSRDDCLKWLDAKGYPRPPKSSCIGCPFHGNDLWRDMKENSPDDWADAVSVDKAIRSGGTLKGMTQAQFMHRSLKPLDEVDLSPKVKRGEPNLFINECEGICGV